MINNYFAFDDQRYLEIKNLVNLFLNENLNYLELAARTHSSVEKVKAKLSNSVVLQMVYPTNYEEIINKVSQKMAELDDEKKDNSHYLRIDAISKNNTETQKKFLLHLALTFRAKFETIYELFGISLYDILDGNDFNQYFDAIKYLNIESFDQEVVKNNIVKFYNQYVDCLRKKDSEGTRTLLRDITDYYAQNLRKKKENDNLFTDDEIMIMLKYQLKYGLKIKQISSIFLINRNTYADRVQSILEKEENALLKMRYNQLFEYNIAIGEKYRKHG